MNGLMGPAIRMLLVNENENLNIYVDTEKGQKSFDAWKKLNHGKLTIGVGYNIQSRSISKDVARLMLSETIREVIRELRQRLDFFGRLDKPRQLVLLDLLFNMGWGGFSEFKNMLAAVKRGDWYRAMLEMRFKDGTNEELGYSDWHVTVKTRAWRMERIMLSGQWPEGELGRLED